MTDDRDFCSVSDHGCLNPAGYGVGGGGYATNPDGPRTRARCSECGEAVCANCRTGKRGHWICKYHVPEPVVQPSLTDLIAALLNRTPDLVQVNARGNVVAHYGRRSLEIHTMTTGVKW